MPSGWSLWMKVAPTSRLSPLYVGAPRGQRAQSSVPRNRGKSTTLLASLSVESIGACMLLEGATTTTVIFHKYLALAQA